MHCEYKPNLLRPKRERPPTMATYSDLLATIVSETLACRDPATQQSKGRGQSRYAPFGPHIPGENGSYRTTDAAMSAIAEVADRFRANDLMISHAHGRDAVRMEASRTLGELLPALAAEPNATLHWPMVRDRLRTRLRHIIQDVVHYLPVWLFLAQDCPAFSIGPVRFIERKDWLDAIKTRRGAESSWMAGVRDIWSGRKTDQHGICAGLKSFLKQVARTPLQPASWVQEFRTGYASGQRSENVQARTVARAAHPDQWIACAEVNGFERDESRRRGVLTIRVALDTIRLVLPGSERHLLSTAADTVVPLTIDRYNQAVGQDLAHGWRFNRPGVSGPPGMAKVIISQCQPVFDAAGECIAAAAGIGISAHACPKLADRWFNSVHWFGRACLSDGDFVAVVMMVIALDVLCGGKQDQGIIELVARLTGTAKSASVLPDGTTLETLVKKSYQLRSEVAHGSVLALHETLDVERGQLESVAAAALTEYVVALADYAKKGGADDRDMFLASLPPANL